MPKPIWYTESRIKAPSNVSEQFPHPVNAALKTRPEKKERNIPIKS
jgi:hypothetical protein